MSVTIQGRSGVPSYNPGGTGAVVTTVPEKLREEISVFDRLTAAEKADVRAGAATLDITSKVQAALDVGAGKRVKFPAGTYYIYALKVHAGTLVDLDDAAIIKKRPAIVGDQSVQQFTGSAVFTGSTRYAPVFWITGNGVTIRGGTIDGNRDNDTLNTGPGLWGGAFRNNANRNGILASTTAIPSVTDITVDNVRFTGMVGLAISLDLAGTVRVTNCREDNAKNIFVEISGDGVNFLTTPGVLIFSGNVLSGGDRALIPQANAGIIERKESVIFTGNIVDSRAISDVPIGGFKFQHLPHAVITGNTFINEYVKPQSSATFYGEVFEIVGNTFISYSPPTHLAGVQMGLHRVKSLTISGNSLVNAKLGLERSSDLVTVVGNTIKITADSRHAGEVEFFAINGGANQVGGIAGTVLVANNTVDLGGLANHSFFESRGGTGNNVGNIELRGNVVHGADHVAYIVAGGDSSAARIKIVGNTFKNFRALGRIDPDGLAELIVKDNVYSNINTEAPSNIGGHTFRPMYLSPGAGTYGTFAFEGNVFNAREVNWFGVRIELGAQTLNTLSVCDNIFDVYDDGASFWSFGVNASTGTITNLWVKNNLAVGSLNFAGTHTNEYIEGNTFTNLTRKVLLTTKKSIGLNGMTQTTVGAAGAASALPATPTGYAVVIIDGVERVIPFYAKA